ncbi:MAG: flagellar basal body P-ring formation chaperone FlgA [Rhodothermaceae bacterium]
MIFNFIISLVLVFNFGSSLERELDRYLKEKLSDYNKFEFRIKSIPKMGNRNNTISINKDKEIKISGKYCYVPVFIHKGNKKMNSIVSLELKLYDEVLIARRKLTKGENLSKSDFTVSEKDITQYRSDIVLGNTSLEFFRAKRSINPGDVLTAGSIEGIPVVNKGDKVIANLLKGNVHITFEALAKQDGKIGDKIRISYQNKYYRAVVTDPYNVKLVE